MKKLKLFMAAFALLLGWSNASAYQTPEANGIYYLYNTACTDGNPGFMSTGNGYGFQVVIDNFGFPVKLIDAGDGNFKFQFIHHNGYLSDDGWMYSDGDDKRARTITIQDQGSGNYRLYNTNNSCWIEDWYGNVVGDGSENRHNYIWQFLSKAERDAIVAGYTTSVKLAAATSMGMPASVDTESEFDDYLSTNYIGIDQSSKIMNGTFDTSHNTEGWTTHNNDNRTFNLGWGDVEPKTTPEVYQGAGYLTHDQISVDNVGLYKVSVNATYRCGDAANNNRIGDLGYDGSVAYLQANNSIAKISDWYSGKINGNGPGNPSEANSVYFAAGKYLTEAFVYVGDAKTIDISLHSHAFTWGGWLVFNNFKLTYYSDAVSEEDATEILSQANALADADMQATVKTALTDAKTTFNGARTIANYNALSTAIDNANTSKNAYANAKAYLDEAATILEGTNVYTTSAYNTYYATPKAAYDAKTLTNEEANALKPTSTGWHSANTIDDILLSAWTIGGEQCKDYDKALYINTWSVEGNTDGSNFLTPFFEYWTSDKSLGTNTLQATVTGLKASTTYSFTIRARVQGTAEKIANGVTMKVGNGETVDISSGAKFSTTDFYIGNFTAVGETDASGKMTMTMTVAENSNISWLSFYNAKYTEGEDLSAYIADYEFARDNAVAAQSKPMDPTKKTVFDAAVSTNGSLNTATATKQELIDAKDALETALAVVTPSIAALAGTSIADWTKTNENGALAANTWSNEGKTDGSNMTTTFAQLWIDSGTSLADGTISYTMTGQAPGYYKLTGLVRSLNEAGGTPAGTFIFANDAIERAYNGSTCTNGVYANPIVYGLVGEDGNLTIGFKIIKGNVNWLSWKNLSVEYLGTELTSAIATNQTEEARTFANNPTAQATQDEAVSALETLSDANYSAAGVAIENAYKAIDRDFSVLQTAIAAKANAVLGFETGEYAPYNLGAPLAAANAIDQNSETSSQSEINAAATALNNVSANDGNVECVYNGNFAEGQGSPAANIQQYGWTRTNDWGQFKNDADATSTTNQTAYYNQPGSLQYGNAGVYTMPLKANTIYNLTFKYASWEANSNNGMTVSVLNSEDGMAAMGFEKNTNVYTASGAFVTKSLVFVTGTAGNYVLTLANSGNTVITDVSITKAASQVLEFADNAAVPTYAPGTYPTVKITRTLTADSWATGVYPFVISDVDGLTTVNMSAFEGDVLTFSEGATVANQPFLMKASSTKSEISLTNVAVAATSGEANQTISNITMKGVYSTGTVPVSEESTYRYIVDSSNNTLRKVVDGGTGVTINPYRAYFELSGIDVNNARSNIRMNFGGITGVENIEAAPVATVKKNGAYLENGKIAIYKNGMKFSATGAKLK